MKDVRSWFMPAFLLLYALSGQGQVRYDELVWADEFSVPGAPDARYWSYDLGTGQSGWGNNEVQSYTQNAQNIRQSEGVLIIDALKSGNAWTSARIKTQGKVSFTYGRVEFRAKLPVGSGTWPAVWLLGESITSKGWPACGEIDVMEFVGKTPGIIHGSLHSPSSFGNTQNTRTQAVPNASTAFHVYAIEWSPEHIRFFVDDNLYYTYAPAVKTDANWPFKEDFFIIINLAMGGNFGSDPVFETNGQRNGIDPALNKATLEVDYVRVYQPFETLAISGPAYVTPGATGLSFSANQVVEASYSWEFPDGVEIMPGEQDSHVSVNWGQQPGTVRLTMDYLGQTYTSEWQVRTIAKPEGSPFLWEGFEQPEVLQQLTTQGGNFQLSQGTEGLRVEYTITNPSLLPSVTWVPDQGLDLREHPILHTSLKTYNQSQTVSVRIDLEDKNGRITGGNQVFNLLPIISDGEFFDYAFDFSPLGGSGPGQVDLSAIAKIRMLVNYGAFGSPGADSLWIREFSVRSTPVQVPARPSGLAVQPVSGGMRLTWRDRSTNEEGFKVLRSLPGEDWEEIAVLGPNIQTFTDPDPQPLSRYVVLAFNAFGASPHSNIVELGDLITSLGAEKGPEIRLFPNPGRDQFFLQLPENLYILHLSVTTVNGGDVATDWALISPGHYQLVLPPVPGLYLCRFTTNQGVYHKKILVQ
jgi:beta-glucanase (GH16 family)